MPKVNDISQKQSYQNTMTHTALAGHFGFKKPYQAIEMKSFWPNMRQDIKEFVSSCESCQRNKSGPGNYGLLQSLPTPNKPWKDISMDFVMSLPKTKNGYTTIFVVVDRFSKMAHFIKTTDEVGAKETATLFFGNIVRLHGLPRKLVSEFSLQVEVLAKPIQQNEDYLEVLISLSPSK